MTLQVVAQPQEPQQPAGPPAPPQAAPCRVLAANFFFVILCDLTNIVAGFCWLYCDEEAEQEEGPGPAPGDAAAAGSGDHDEVDDVVTPPKRKADEALTDTPWKERLECGLVGGKQAKCESCSICSVKRPDDQKGSACPLCVHWCRKLFGHQRTREVSQKGGANLDELRSKSLEDRAKRSLEPER